MKKSTATILLVIIFILTLFSRSFITMQTESFSYEAYFSLRQIESINDNGFPLFEDSLSYGGRLHLFPPLFYYLIALFSFIGPTLMAKIIPNLLLSMVVFIVYLISFLITKNRPISLLTAFFSGFIPILYLSINDVSPYSLVVPLIFLILYFIMRLEDDFYLKSALFLLTVLVLSHASAFLLILGLLMFWLLLKIESQEVNKKELELILFSSFLVIWFNFIVYKKAFLIHGPLVIWQNIPLQILTNYFMEFNLIQSIYFIGIIPVIFGVHATYNVLFKVKRRNMFLLLGLFFAVIILLWFKLIQFEIGLLFLGLSLVILSSHSIKLLYSYLQKTKFPSSANWFLVGLLAVFIFTSLIPSLSIGSASLENTPSEQEIEALLWLRNNTPEDSVVVARSEEGFAINYIANRKSVIDQDFLMIEDAQQRYEDVNSIFSLRLKTEAIRRLDKYDVDYIYFSGKFGSQKKLYYVDEDCFELVFNNSVEIYSVRCHLK